LQVVENAELEVGSTLSPFFGTKVFIPIISNSFGRAIFCSAAVAR
jgi:hypothetical protein